MKPFLLLLSAVALISLAGKNKHDVVRKKQVGPPGTLLLHGNLYMDETEITNFSWLEYLYWLKRAPGENSMKTYEKALPDTSVWGETTTLEQQYLRHPVYRNYPVVGVSQQQAQDYCAWRTDRVKELFAIQDSIGKKNRGAYRRFANFTYRLPTEKEWEMAALAGLDSTQFSYGFESLTTKKGGNILNTHDKAGHGDADASADRTYDTYFGKPNKYGYYNMIGNVAEMVEEEGIAKGGSWSHQTNESEVVQQINYTAPKNWLGFRCICEIIEE